MNGSASSFYVTGGTLRHDAPCVRGLVHLAGRSFPIPFPERRDAIAVGAKCRQIHFLHGTAFSAVPGMPIASYVVHCPDGRTNEVPVLYGRDVRTRWLEAGPEAGSEQPQPAWISPPHLAGPRGRSLRLYHQAWTNPRPDLEIERIDFVAHQTAAAPFLVAVTLE